MTPTPETLKSATKKEKEQRQRRANSKELQKQATARAASLSSNKITNSRNINGKKGSNKNNFLPSLKTQKMNTIDNDVNLSETKRQKKELLNIYPSIYTMFCEFEECMIKDGCECQEVKFAIEEAKKLLQQDINEYSKKENK